MHSRLDMKGMMGTGTGYGTLLLEDFMLQELWYGLSICYYKTRYTKTLSCQTRSSFTIACEKSAESTIFLKDNGFRSNAKDPSDEASKKEAEDQGLQWVTSRNRSRWASRLPARYWCELGNLAVFCTRATKNYYKITKIRISGGQGNCFIGTGIGGRFEHKSKLHAMNLIQQWRVQISTIQERLWSWANSWWTQMWYAAPIKEVSKVIHAR